MVGTPEMENQLASVGLRVGQVQKTLYQIGRVAQSLKGKQQLVGYQNFD